jgi:eukaryotic-like serine/threonine-protein kinase
MDLLEGRSLADVIKSDGQVPVERALRIFSQACDALNHAHKQGVIHRDLKPTNIVLCTFDEQADFVKIVDFGVAKLLNASEEGQRLTQAGEVCGSPVYMSPEQCMGQDLDRRSDVYSMGVVVYETLTGKLPILGKTMVDTMSRHISEPPVRFNEARPDLYIPERLEAVVFKALSKDRNDRHQSMDHLRADLETAIPRPGRSEVLRSPQHENYAAPPKPAASRKSAPTPIIAAAAAVIVAIIGAVAFMSSHKAPAVQPHAVTTMPAQPSPGTTGSTPDKTASPSESAPNLIAAPTGSPSPPQSAGSKPATVANSQSTAAESQAHANGTESGAASTESQESAEPSKPKHKPHKTAHSTVASTKKLTAAVEPRPAPKADIRSRFDDLRNSHSYDQ